MIKEIKRFDVQRKIFTSRILNKMSYGCHMSTNTTRTPLQLDTAYFLNLVVKD